MVRKASFFLCALLFVSAAARAGDHEKTDWDQSTVRERRAHQTGIYKERDFRRTSQAFKGHGTPFRHAIRIESTSIDFPDATPGENMDLPSGLVVRVFADSKWELKLFAVSPLRVADHSEVSISRLKIRTMLTSSYVPIPEGRHMTLAKGHSTSPAGELIFVDLRLNLQSNDPVGQYFSSLRLFLERR